MNDFKYRPDIDGLRAVAVISVFFYHLGFTGFSGGFVGVDIFFVISGFLITQLIRNEVRLTETFNYSNFYIRRARRLFPALFITLLASLIIAVNLFSPQHLERFGGSLVHAISSVSNFFFWSEAGYFDTDSITKPLLHTWSLSVEEQFYLIYPISLVLLLKSKIRFLWVIILLLAGMVSLYLNLMFTDTSIQSTDTKILQLAAQSTIFGWDTNEQSTIFYLLPFRIFEFAIGGLLVWCIEETKERKKLNELVFAVGFILIIYSVFTFTENMIFPSYNALIPCLGAAMIIYARYRTRFGFILSNPVSVGLGLISYSLYLVHWPIIVFLEYWKFEKLALNEKIYVVIVAIIIAIAMYEYIERPFRFVHKLGNKESSPAMTGAGFGLSVFALSIVLIIPASNMWRNDGWSWRIPENVRSISQNRRESRADTWTLVKKHNLKKFNLNDKSNILIVGDSHGKDLFNSFVLNESLSESLNVAYFKIDTECIRGFNYKLESIVYSDNQKRNTILSKRCPSQLERFKNTGLLKDADWVLASFKWLEDMDNFSALIQMDGIIKNVSNRNKYNKLVVLGRTVGFKKHIPELVMNFGRIHPKKVLEEHITSYRDESIDVINNDLKVTSEKQGWIYLDKYPLLCDKGLERCSVLDSNNKLIYFDEAHWTLDGAKFVGYRINTNNDFLFMRKKME
jgi:peptidoglycan/LPS O-acetylase OafA/YrhL